MGWRIRGCDDHGKPLENGMKLLLIDSFEGGLLFGCVFVVIGRLAGFLECSWGNMIMMLAGVALYVTGRRYWPKKKGTEQ